MPELARINEGSITNVRRIAPKFCAWPGRCGVGWSWRQLPTDAQPSPGQMIDVPYQR